MSARTAPKVRSSGVEKIAERSLVADVMASTSEPSGVDSDVDTATPLSWNLPHTLKPRPDTRPIDTNTRSNAACKKGPGQPGLGC